MLEYATPADYTAWTGSADAPDNLPALLRAASGLIARHTRTARYHADPVTRLPKDPDLAAALRDATCAQAATWAALAIDPVKGPAGAAAGTVQSSSIGGASITRSDPAQTILASMAATTDLAPAAYDVLSLAGLLSSRVRAW